MDPLSITTACVALLGVIGKTSHAIASFVRTCSEARDDLAAVSRELSALCAVLGLLIEDATSTDATLPAAFQKHILVLVDNCSDVINQIARVLENHGGRTGPARWASDGNDEVKELRVLLEIHKGSLSLALELANLKSARAIRDDTAVIRHGTANIKDDTTKLLLQICQITVQIAKLRPGVAASRGTDPIENQTIDLWLESLTNYAETVCGDLIHDVLPETGSEHAPSECLTPSESGEEIEEGGDLKVYKTHHLTGDNEIHYICLWENILVGTDGFDNTIIWDVVTGIRLGSFNSNKRGWGSRDEHHIRVSYICGHPDYVCVHDLRNEISIWEWKRKKRVFTLPRERQSNPSSQKSWLRLSIVSGMSEGDGAAFFWADGRSLWKVRSSDWRANCFMTFASGTTIMGQGTWHGSIAIMLDNGYVAVLDAITGTIKATKLVCSSEQVKATRIHKVSWSQDKSRVSVISDDLVKNHVTVAVWHIKSDTVTTRTFKGLPIRKAGVEKIVTEEKSMKIVEQEKGQETDIDLARSTAHEMGEVKKSTFDALWFDTGSILYLASGEILDLIDVETCTRRRYKTPFATREELKGTPKEIRVRLGLFGRRKCEFSSDTGSQCRLNSGKTSRTVVTRAVGGAVQVWNLDIRDMPFVRRPE